MSRPKHQQRLRKPMPHEMEMLLTAVLEVARRQLEAELGTKQRANEADQNGIDTVGGEASP